MHAIKGRLPISRIRYEILEYKTISAEGSPREFAILYPTKHIGLVGKTKIWS